MFVEREVEGPTGLVAGPLLKPWKGKNRECLLSVILYHTHTSFKITFLLKLGSAAAATPGKFRHFQACAMWFQKK